MGSAPGKRGGAGSAFPHGGGGIGQRGDAVRAPAPEGRGRAVRPGSGTCFPQGSSAPIKPGDVDEPYAILLAVSEDGTAFETGSS